MRVIGTILLLVLVGFGIFWFINQEKGPPNLEEAGEQLSSKAEQVKDSVQEQLSGLSLNKENIEEELARTGKIVRQKANAVGTVLKDVTQDARVTASIKGQLAVDPDLSALSISVNTTDGVVTLAGSVSSAREIGKAMVLALETEGVREVISTLQIKGTNTPVSSAKTNN